MRKDKSICLFCEFFRGKICQGKVDGIFFCPFAPRLFQSVSRRSQKEIGYYKLSRSFNHGFFSSSF